ncbi:hypothetical protein DNL40_04465 [Xylanimonas oleitrophica]|uniref:Uncharacterized protein n=1 Tax=Xylanimonas oleitrophica TaxID=2607479 RepID=A0A2W5WRP9_9MICO|nr:hypothetical protein [Xylanimonas oleitrophica]PZR54189.1 hypothetical protein DNL40_04465 [Xylanimonas oleitrophica]
MTKATPRSLLFLSCDLVGSTQYKQREPLWQEAFLSFYREFPQILGELTLEKKYAPGFDLWKPVGDELIFTTPVTTETDVFRATRIWVETMDAYEKGPLRDVGMKTKGGAFIATFPGPDSESSIPRDPTIEKSDKGVVELNDEALTTRSPNYLYDYFGPSIDTGFRVLSACSNRYFTLSVETAWALAQCAVDSGVRNEFPVSDLRLLDSREFKGVWNGREYPLFALDRHSLDSVYVAMARIHSETVEPIDVVNLCRECLGKPDWPSGIYLPDSGHVEFRNTPVDTLDDLRTNSMEGAETVLPEGDTGDNLEQDAPLGDEVVQS